MANSARNKGTKFETGTRKLLSGDLSGVSKAAMNRIPDRGIKALSKVTFEGKTDEGLQRTGSRSYERGDLDPDDTFPWVVECKYRGPGQRRDLNSWIDQASAAAEREHLKGNVHALPVVIQNRSGRSYAESLVTMPLWVWAYVVQMLRVTTDGEE